MTPATTPDVPQLERDEVAELVDELRGWHDNLDEATADGSPIRIYHEGGESEQARLNLRAALREAVGLLLTQRAALAAMEN